ncbi:MAG: SDR family oxidoreductase [Euryarchaeota archaeon]|nr:SDR family oxidoreductase [Euryarchaeota archaeon]
MARKVALVTGGAIRVGRSIALALADAGYDIAITYRTSGEEAERTVEDLRARGAEAIETKVDFTDLGATRALPTEVVRRLGRLDLLVNSASVFHRSPLGSVTPADWDDLFTLNAKAPFFLTQSAVPHLESGTDPSVVNLLDVSTHRPWPSYLPYCASKAALEALTVGLAKALAPRIRVNGVAPGPVLPPDDYDDAEKERAAKATLLERWGGPEDVARAVVHLAAATYTTGAVLPVDGGRHVA